MTLVHDGQGDNVAEANLRDKDEGRVGGSSRGLEGIDWGSWIDRFHLKQVTMLGHSFGAATTVGFSDTKTVSNVSARASSTTSGARPIQLLEDEPDHRIRTLLLGINSEAFMYWPDNFEAVMSLCWEVKEQDQLAWLMTVRGSVHVSQSDFSLLYPRIASLLLKQRGNPRRAIDLNINASLEFLKQVMPARISEMNRGTNEHLLEVSTLDKLPSEHRLNDKWTAVRLHIPHEMRMRLTPQWIRRYTWNKKRRDAERRLPKDPQGHVLEGLEDLELGEEIWMHVAPTKEELLRHGLKPKKELERHQSDGMVEVTGQEGRRRSDHRGIEQKYMERG
jgi:platelet-activating factor acetylhydrolase